MRYPWQKLKWESGVSGPALGIGAQHDDVAAIQPVICIQLCEVAGRRGGLEICDQPRLRLLAARQGQPSVPELMRPWMDSDRPAVTA